MGLTAIRQYFGLITCFEKNWEKMLGKLAEIEENSDAKSIYSGVTSIGEANILNPGYIAAFLIQLLNCLGVNVLVFVF